MSPSRRPDPLGVADLHVPAAGSGETPHRPPEAYAIAGALATGHVVADPLAPTAGERAELADVLGALGLLEPHRAAAVHGAVRARIAARHG